MRSRLVQKDLGGIRLLGYSLAGEETVLVAPELNVCFDAGRAPAEIISVDYLCLTHGHMDHAAGVAYYFSQRAFVGNAPGCLLAPRALVGALEDLMAVWARIEGHPSPARIIGMRPGDAFPIRRDLFIHAFAVNHGGPALGYVVVESRKKLKPEFAGYSGPQLVELKKQGVEIQYELQVPLVAYCGDTAAGDFLDLDLVRNSRVFVIECTFFDDAHIRRARAGRHLHITDLPGVLARVNSPHVLLTHLTRRTAMHEAKRMLKDALSPADFERVSLLMDRPRRPRRAPNG